MWRGKTRPTESPSTSGALGKETGSERKLCKGKNVCNKSASSNFNLIRFHCFIVFTVTPPFSFLTTCLICLLHLFPLIYSTYVSYFNHNWWLFTVATKTKLIVHEWVFQMFNSSASCVWMWLWLGECYIIWWYKRHLYFRSVFIKMKKSSPFYTKLYIPNGLVPKISMAPHAQRATV